MFETLKHELSLAQSPGTEFSVSAFFLTEWSGKKMTGGVLTV
jgi:hypothetical protein